MAVDTPNGNANPPSPPNANGSSSTKTEDTTLEDTNVVRKIGKFKLRGQTDDLPQNWWFASTAIPLLAATIGPLANVLSIAALVSTWRVSLPDNGQLPLGTDDLGVGIPDPHWEIVLNSISLACGCVGNFCLLLNFTKRIRYIVALPATIIAWYFATGILIGIITAMNKYDPPIRPGQTYSQGFWHAVIAAVLYLISSMMLMVNMLGYLLGHYPQHFDLDDNQRTLILQTMMFFFWLAGGAGVFAKVCDFSYANALYFCDVTVLTIGFGDIVANNTVSRGLIFPYSLFGIIFLGLMVNSIRKFASGMSNDNVIKKHQRNERERTFGRTVTNENELRDRLGLPPRRESQRPPTARKDPLPLVHRNSLEEYGHLDVKGRAITFRQHIFKGGDSHGDAGKKYKPMSASSRYAKMQQRETNRGIGRHIKRSMRREKLLLLREEKDRFDAMREIQAHTSRFKSYYSLTISVSVFGLVWCLGALAFEAAEKRIQDLTYFDALYFCFVSLLTIGYGDFSPRSNAGKPFFIVWSLIAIPTMTVLVSDMSKTVVVAYNRGTFAFADWTVMPKEGVWRDFLEQHPRLKNWLEEKRNSSEAQQRIDAGFALQNPDEEVGAHENENETKETNLERLAEEPTVLTDHDLARKLALAIKMTANDLRLSKPKKYSYEEWVEFTRLIRFSQVDSADLEAEEEEEGLIDWDWIGEDSPLLADATESEWVLDRLCESLNRYTRKMSRLTKENDKMKQKPAKDFVAEVKPETDGLKHRSSLKRQEAHHAQHIDIYPAHPGPRGEHSYTRSSPIHSGPTSKSGPPRASEDVVVEDNGECSGTGGKGDMSATTAVASPVSWTGNWDPRVDTSEVGLARRYDGLDWAVRPASQEDTLAGDTPVEDRNT